VTGSEPVPAPSSSSLAVDGGSNPGVLSMTGLASAQPSNGSAIPTASATIALAANGLPAASTSAVVIGPGGTAVPILTYRNIDFPGADLPPPDRV